MININKDKLLKKFAEHLHIKINGYGFSNFCESTDFSKKTIDNWLNARKFPKVNDVIFLAKFFNCTANYLLGLEDEYGNKIY